MATWLQSLCSADGVFRDASSRARGSSFSNISLLFKCWCAARRSSVLQESIRACHCFPSVRGHDLCAAGHPAEAASQLERAGLWLREGKQGSGLAIYADFRHLPVCSCSSCHGSVGAEVALCMQPRELPVTVSVCSLVSPSAAVLPKTCGICKRTVGLYLLKSILEAFPTQVCFLV